MNKKNMAKTNRNQKANNLCELSMDDLDWVTGGELTEEQRAHFIRTLTNDKKMAVTKPMPGESIISPICLKSSKKSGIRCEIRYK